MKWSKMKLTQESFLVKMKLTEYKRMISVMSDSQLRTELSTLETLKTQVLKKQEDEAANNRELHAALKKEGEELEDQRRKKRQFIRLKETVEGPTQHGRIGPSWPSTQNAIEALESSFPELETLASLKKRVDMKSMPKSLMRSALHGQSRLHCMPKSLMRSLHAMVQRQLHHVPGNWPLNLLRRRLGSRKGSGSKSLNHESQLCVFSSSE